MLCLSESCVYCVAVLFLLLILLKVFVRFTLGISKSSTCLVGKTVLITGGNSGLGFQTALALAGRGARVIIADKNDANESVKRIADTSGNRNVVYKYVDLSSLTSVRKFAREVNEEEEHLDILINNAGCGSGDGYTEDGLQLAMQVNHFGPFLLTHLLVDLLKKSAPSRIIFVSSILAFTNNLTVENLNKKPTNLPTIFSDVVLYGNSKLMNIITANIFSEKLHSNGITTCSVHPGAVNTEIYRNFEGHDALPLQKFIIYKFILPLFGKSTWEGAQTQIEGAISKELGNVTGKYLVDCRVFPQPWKASNEELCKKLWKRSEELVKLKESEKLK